MRSKPALWFPHFPECHLNEIIKSVPANVDGEQEGGFLWSALFHSTMCPGLVPFSRESDLWGKMRSGLQIRGNISRSREQLY